jgi:hypothetical protein
MEFTMVNRRYVVEQNSWLGGPTLRDETEFDVLANLDVDGDLIQFELDTCAGSA